MNETFQLEEGVRAHVLARCNSELGDQPDGNPNQNRCGIVCRRLLCTGFLPTFRASRVPLHRLRTNFPSLESRLAACVGHLRRSKQPSRIPVRISGPARSVAGPPGNGRVHVDREAGGRHGEGLVTWKASYQQARWLMVAVAVVALMMGAELTRRRWAHRQQMARHYARAERTYGDQAKEIADEIDRGRSDLDLALERRLWMADRARQFRRTWERGAARPWESEPSEPPRLSDPPPPADLAGR